MYLTWDQSLPAGLVEPLQALCRKVTFIGHSASLVQMWVAPDPPPERASAQPEHGQASEAGRLMLIPQPGGPLGGFGCGFRAPGGLINCRRLSSAVSVLRRRLPWGTTRTSDARPSLRRPLRTSRPR